MFQNLNFQFKWTTAGAFMGNLNVTSVLKGQIHHSQLLDVEMQAMANQPGFAQAMDGVARKEKSTRLYSSHGWTH